MKIHIERDDRFTFPYFYYIDYILIGCRKTKSGAKRAVLRKAKKMAKISKNGIIEEFEYPNV